MNTKLILSIALSIFTFFLGGRLLTNHVQVTFPNRLLKAETLKIKCGDLELIKEMKNSSRKSFKFLVPGETNCEFILLIGNTIYSKEYYVQPGFDLLLDIVEEKLVISLR